MSKVKVYASFIRSKNDVKSKKINVCLFVYLSESPSAHPTYLSLRKSVRPSSLSIYYLSIYLSGLKLDKVDKGHKFESNNVCVPVRLPAIRLSFCLSFCLIYVIYLYQTYLPTYISVYLSIYLSIYLLGMK